MTLERTKPCRCANCVEACTREPGRFAPGEAEAAARLLGMEFEEFAQLYLVVDYWSGGACCWAPAKAGLERPADAWQPVSWGYAFEHGRCVFLTDKNRCRIHKAKPLECAAALCCSSEGESNKREEINKLWEASGSPLGRMP